MQFKNTVLKASLCLLYFLTPSSYSCSTLFWNNNGIDNVVARSMDLYISDVPKLVVYPRNTERTGVAGNNSLTWRSHYGNVVVTAFDTKTVSDGMNEHGLAVHLLYLTDTKYPEISDQAPKISNALWAQYILDNYKTVDEALAATKDLPLIATEVQGQKWPIHLAMEDTSGDSAIVEYIDGKRRVHHGAQYRIMTNEPAYSIQLDNLKHYKTFGGNLAIPGGPDPISRFVRASYYLKSLPKPKDNIESIAGVLAVIRTVMVPFGALNTANNGTVDAWATRWITIADLKNRMYFFQSTVTPNLLWIDLNKLDFTAGAPVKSINPVDIHLVGDVTKSLN